MSCRSGCGEQEGLHVARVDLANPIEAVIELRSRTLANLSAPGCTIKSHGGMQCELTATSASSKCQAKHTATFLGLKRHCNDE